MFMNSNICTFCDYLFPEKNCWFKINTIIFKKSEWRELARGSTGMTAGPHLFQNADSLVMHPSDH